MQNEARADLLVAAAKIKKGDLERGKEEGMKASAPPHQPFVRSSSCQNSVGKRRHPRPINCHASTEATGFWGPRRSAFDPLASPRSQARARLGPGDYFRLSGNGGPQIFLPAARGVAWLAGLYGTSSSTRHSIPSLGAKPRDADDARPPQERPRQAGSRGAERSRQGKPREVLVT